MKREEYETFVRIVNAEIERLTSERSKAKQKYIETNKKFSIGEKVAIKGVSGTRYGFVSNISVGYKSELNYRINKCKKDGTMSTHKDYVDTWGEKEVIAKLK